MRILRQKQPPAHQDQQHDSAVTRMQQCIDHHSIISKTDVAGRIIYANELFERISGYSSDELLGQTHRIIKSDRHPKSFYDDMWKTISSGNVWQGEVCNRRKNGEYYWVESTIVPFCDDKGIPYEYISVRTDVTKIKEFEQAMLIAKNEAEEANNIKSKFLSNISHELRTPLNAIIGFAQVMELNESIDEEGKDHLNEINKAGQYLLSLFNDLLDLGCIENNRLSINKTIVSLHEVLDECIHLITIMASAQNIQLIFDIENCESIFINIDEKRLKQVVINLLSNAVKYNKPNGEVIIQCYASENGDISIDIIDTGEGLSEEEISLIFKPFVRVGENQNTILGTGVGLSLSKSIMQKMDGDIYVQSIKGQGSTFTINIPASAIQ